MSLGNRCGFYSRRDVYRTPIFHAKDPLPHCKQTMVIQGRMQETGGGGGGGPPHFYSVASYYNVLAPRTR